MAKKKQKQEIDLSDTIVQVTELQRKFLFYFIERQGTCLNAIEDMFEVLYDFHPELKNYYFNYNSETGEVSVLAKKTGRKK